MPFYTGPHEIVGRCHGLMYNEQARNRKIEEWYRLANLEPDRTVPQEMENFTGNDPKTFFNFGRFLLSTSAISHDVDTDLLNDQQAEAASTLTNLMDRAWKYVFSQESRKGRGTWLERLCGLMLMQGQYAVVARGDREKLRIAIWNPYQVYADFDDGLAGPSEVCRVYEASDTRIRAIARQEGWDLGYTFPRGHATVYIYYGFDAEGQVHNSVVIHNRLVYQVFMPSETRIPVYTGKIGGLPEIGIVLDSRNVFEGESVLETNLPIYQSINRMMTHIQQMTKDAAQPPLWERNSGARNDKILDENRIFKRAYVARMGPNDSIGALDLPGIPPEASQQLLNINDMRQRGSVPDAAFGNLQQSGINSLLMNQVIQATRIALHPYQEAVKSLLNHINEMYARKVVAFNWEPYGWRRPQNLPEPEDISFNTDFRISIPGDLAARATTMRIISPDATFSPETTMELMFPEIKDPQREIARSRSSKIINSEIDIAISQIEAYWVQAELLRNVGNPRAAALRDAVASRLEQQLAGEMLQQATPNPQLPPPQRNGTQPRQEVLPREALQ